MRQNRGKYFYNIIEEAFFNSLRYHNAEYDEKGIKEFGMDVYQDKEASITYKCKKPVKIIWNNIKTLFTLCGFLNSKQQEKLVMSLYDKIEKPFRSTQEKHKTIKQTLEKQSSKKREGSRRESFDRLDNELDKLRSEMSKLEEMQSLLSLKPIQSKLGLYTSRVPYLLLSDKKNLSKERMLALHGDCTILCYIPKSLRISKRDSTEKVQFFEKLGLTQVSPQEKRYFKRKPTDIINVGSVESNVISFLDDLLSKDLCDKKVKELASKYSDMFNECDDYCGIKQVVLYKEFDPKNIREIFYIAESVEELDCIKFLTELYTHIACWGEDKSLQELLKLFKKNDYDEEFFCSTQEAFFEALKCHNEEYSEEKIKEYGIDISYETNQGRTWNSVPCLRVIWLMISDEDKERLESKLKQENKELLEKFISIKPLLYTGDFLDTVFAKMIEEESRIANAELKTEELYEEAMVDIISGDIGIPGQNVQDPEVEPVRGRSIS